MASVHPISLSGRRGVRYHLGISGGKDSTALLLWAKYESGYTAEQLCVTFCDTGNESGITYAHIQMLSERVHPIEVIRPPLNFWELAAHKKRFPAAKARFCTQHLKMLPTKAYVRALIEQGFAVTVLSGVRAAESDDRAKLPERESARTSFFGCDLYRPLLRWSLEDVWAIHARYGIPRNPLYDLGCSRVGCFPCIMARKREIALIARKFPERIELIRAQEQAVQNPCGYASLFHRTRIPDRYRTQLITSKAKPVADDAPSDPSQLVLTEIACGVSRRQERPSETVRVATIDDVVQWALNDPDFYQAELEEVDFGEEAPACDSQYGACE